MFGSKSVEAETISTELDTLLGDAFSTGRRVLKVRVHVVLWGPSVDHLRTLEDKVIQAGVSLDLQFLREPTLGSTLFVHALPLGFDPLYPREDELRRSRTVPADNAAHLLPLYGGFRGTATPAAFYLNRRGETVVFDHFDFPTAPHALVTGTSGAGKSFFVNHFVQQVLPLGASVVIFDRLSSYESLCTAHGGWHITIDFDHPICSNPFVGPFDASHRAFLSRLLTAMASQDEDHISVEERGVFAEALGIFTQNLPHDREPTLSDFIPILRDTRFEWVDQGRRLALRLAPFYGDGPYAGFVDGPNAFELHEQLTVIELSQLREAPDLQTVLMLVLMHHLTLYFAAPARRNRRKYMFNDEVWALMQHPVSARILVEMARTFRKLRTSAIFISQQGTDYAGPTGQAIKANTSVAYFLQQDAGEIEMLRTLFDLTPAEADLLKTVHRRPRWSEAYLRIPEHKGGVVRIVPDPYLRLMATQDPVELAAREAALDAADGDLHAALCQLAHDDLLKKELL
jgi:conjugal transfer ATP-binding protein TraC